MLTYRLQTRVIEVKAEKGFELTYPAKIAIHINLEPKVPFGGHKGISRNVPKGPTAVRQVNMRVNRSVGTFSVEHPEPLFDALDAAMTCHYGGKNTYSIKSNGNIITFEETINNIELLNDRIITLYNIFPAILSIFLPDAPYPTHVWGEINGRPFQWLYGEQELHLSTIVASKDGQEENLLRAWHIVNNMGGSNRFAISLHYFHTGCRLINVGVNKFEFMGEAILDFARSLQMLFGQSMEKMRNELRKLGYTKQEIEGKYVPIINLRHYGDAAHIHSVKYTPGQLRLIYDFCLTIENSMRDLFKRIVEKLETKEGFAFLSDLDSKITKQQRRFLKDLERDFKPFRT